MTADRRLARPLRPIAAVLAVSALVVASFVVGQRFAPLDEKVIAEQNAPIDAYADVESRVVSAGLVLSGVVKEAKRIDLNVPGLAPDHVVVRSPLKTGDLLRPGGLVSVINGRPYIALGQPLALYRDLKIGDSGDDVELFQARLSDAGYATSRSGTVTRDTVDAAARLFKAYGFALPTVTETVSDSPEPDSAEGRTASVIPGDQFLSIPEGRNVVVKSAGVGSRPGDGPVATLRRGQNYVEARLDITEIDEVKSGDEVQVEFGAQTATGKIAEIGDFTTDDDGASGYSVTVEPSDLDADWKPETAATLRAGGTEEATLAVPTIAVRSDSEGDFVTKKDGEVKTRVGVKVLRSDAGFAAIEAKLNVGDQVLIS